MRVEGDLEVSSTTIRRAGQRGRQLSEIAQPLLGGRRPGDELLHGVGRHSRAWRDAFDREYRADSAIGLGVLGEIEIPDQRRERLSAGMAELFFVHFFEQLALVEIDRLGEIGSDLQSVRWYRD